MAPQHNGSDAVDFDALESKVSFISYEESGYITLSDGIFGTKIDVMSSDAPTADESNVMTYKKSECLYTPLISSHNTLYLLHLLLFAAILNL